MKRGDCYGDRQESKRPRLDNNAAMGETLFMEEWDDDLAGDLLEEVCVLAELTQTIPVVVDDTDLENKRLKEVLKTKEGEVGILRSQLKQQQSAKASDAINNLRAIDKLEEKHKTGVESLKKQIEQLQGELQFKDLEVKTLVEKCKQLEVKSPGMFVQPVKKLSGSCEVVKTGKIKKTEPVIKGDGERLRAVLDPCFAQFCEEPSVISMFESKASYQSSLDLAKSEKYKWSGLPVFRSRYSLLLPIVMDLMKSNVFGFDALNEVCGIFKEVFQNLKDLLTFLGKLPMSIDHDKALLENTNPGRVLGLSDIVSRNFLHPLEKGIEARRTLGVVCCIACSSSSGFKTLASVENVTILAGVVEAVGKILRPVEFSGVCVGVCFFLQILLEQSDELDATLLKIIQKILSDLILSRPKLDVLREIFSTLCAGAHHKDLQNLCKRSSPETSTLYMDSRLQQALFVTRDACPVKLLQIQAKTLSHLSNSASAVVEMTRTVTQWLHSVLANAFRPPSWLFPDNECCNILECFCYLLTLLVPLVVNNPELCEVFEKGIMTLRDCCKGHKKKLKQTTVKLLPFKVRSGSILDLLSPQAREAAFYVISEYEADVVTQETAAGLALNTSET